MRNAILAVCLVIIGFIIFNLFSKDTSSPPEIPVEQSIQQVGFYHYFSGTLSGGLSDMIDEVNQSQNQFKVKATALDHEAFKSMIHTTLNKANPPELFSYWAGARVQHLVGKGKLAVIDDLWEKQGFDTRFSPSIIDAACTYGGKKYLLPINQHFVVFFYNTRFFSDLNLKPPKTWEEFIHVCEQLKQNATVPIALGAKERWPAQFWLDYLLLRTQKIEYRNRLMNGKASYTDDEVKQVYQVWSDLLTKGYFNSDANELDWAEATRLVYNEKAAMTLMGSWAIPLLKMEEDCEAKVQKFDFFAFPVIDPSISKTALGPVDGIVLSKNSSKIKYSKLTLAYFASKEAQKRMSKGSGALAPSLDVPLNSYCDCKKRLKLEIQSSDHWAFNYDLATPPQIAELGMNSFKELIAFPDQYEQILENLDQEARIAFEQMNE